MENIILIVGEVVGLNYISSQRKLYCERSFRACHVVIAGQWQHGGAFYSATGNARLMKAQFSGISGINGIGALHGSEVYRINTMENSR
jgi:hypothetical protein